MCTLDTCAINLIPIRSASVPIHDYMTLLCTTPGRGGDVQNAVGLFKFATFRPIQRAELNITAEHQKKEKLKQLWHSTQDCA